MSYYISKSISDNEYNLLSNASNLEELENARDLFMSWIKSEEQETENNIGIRVLSMKEYEKYILNDTLSGSIVEGNEDTWHKLIPQSYTNNLYIYFGQELRRETLHMYFENYADNINNIVPRKYTYSIALGSTYMTGRESYWKRTSMSSVNNDSKDFTTYSNSITAYNDNPFNPNEGTYDNPRSTYYVGIRVFYYEHKCFRPVFQFQDNKKSYNVFY